jgi:signal transduction histidine kinase
MGYSFYMGDRMVTRYDPLVDAAMEIKLEATIAHLWFEELLSGDRSLNIETVIEHIDQSIWYANAMLIGGENPEGTYFPLNDPSLEQKISAVIKDLNQYRELTFKRFAAAETSGPGTPFDQKYDTIFNNFSGYADQVETLLQKKIRQEILLYRKMQGVLIIFVLILSVAILSLHVKFDRRHEADLAEITKEVEVRKAAEEKLRDMNNLKDGFISIAAHELRSPLAVLHGYTELLLEEKNMVTAVREDCLKHILDKTCFMNQLVEEFLDVSRLESGNPLRFEKSQVKVSAIVRQVLQHHQEDSAQHNFQLSFDDEQFEVFTDPGRLHQVFENLIGNAIKYSPEGGRIEVTGERCAEHYQLCVSDEGIGMSAEQQALVFEKYYRVNPAYNAVKGLGIGLYLVRNIIELQGGRIWVESRPQEGSKFFFTLPLAATETESSDNPPPCAA